MSAATHLKNEMVSGSAVKVNVHTNGYFEVTLPDGSRLSFEQTYEQALAKARKEVAKTKTRVSVPFRALTPGAPKGTATGLHGRTGKVLARVGGQAEQLENYAQVWNAETPSDVLERWDAINAQIRALENERRVIAKEWHFLLKGVVERAVNDAAETVEAKTELTREENVSRG